MVSHIRYVYQSSNLFGEKGDVDLYDELASARKYELLCRKKLEQVYPDALIEIFSEEQIWEEGFGTQVDGDQSKEATGPIEYLCSQVYDSFAWVVTKEWFDLSQSADRLHLPVPVVHWLCREGLIKPKYSEGIWRIPTQALSGNVNGQILRFPGKVEIPGHITVHLCRLDDTLVGELPDLHSGVKALVCTSHDFGNPFFSGNNSYLEISSVGDDVELVFDHFADRVPWIVDSWSYDAYTQALMLQAQQCDNVRFFRAERQYSNRRHTESVQLRFSCRGCAQNPIMTIIRDCQSALRTIVEDTGVRLQNGPVWKTEYEKRGNEPQFCQEVLEKLLQRMGFARVRYIHGYDEYGRDFILAEQTKWGWSQYCGIQVKAGDISGGANSQIDMILGQLEDAFTMPIQDQDSKEIYINTFVVAISGHFTKHAKEKIIQKIPRKDWLGSVHFLDQDDIRDLIRRHWLTGISTR